MMDDDKDVAKVDGRNSAGPVLSALAKAHDDGDMRTWRDVCERVEFAYGEAGMSTSAVALYYGERGLDDGGRLDLFWSSYEVMKPAVYAKPPVPAVAAKFSDGDRVIDTTAETLERAAITVLDLNNIDCTMKQVRDDLLFFGRAVMWLTYETVDGEQKVCIDHVDRDDFRHEPARYWDRVGWVAKRAWLSKDEVRERFGDKVAEDASYQSVRHVRLNAGDAQPDVAGPAKCGVWEVWHKADNKVYWVSDGIAYVLDEDEPHLKLRDFFPCPRPAYGTTKLRTLAPIPDYERYAEHYAKISELTGRIYSLLEWVKMKGLVPGGGDTAEAIKAALADTSDATVIAVPQALIQGGTGDFVQWMPLQAIAEAITGLIAARDELISKYYELSGISDIMRGATEAEETLGAQQLKSQYGSVRVREKIDELQRIAADCVKIACEIIAEKFSQKSILEMSGMKLLTRKEIEKRIREVEKAAEEEMKALAQKVEEASQASEGEQADPAQLQQMFEAEQAKIVEKYAPMLQEAEAKVSIEAVMELLRDDRVRSFTFDIESDSTILTDEMQEKASRAEFVQMVGTLLQQSVPIAAGNEQMAEFVGSVMKFAVAPYRAGRTLEGAIDKLVEALPSMSPPGGNQGSEAEQALAEANAKIAEAELGKAQAAIAKVQADTQKAQQEIELKAQEAGVKAQQDQQRFQLEIATTQGNMTEQGARIEKIEADIQLAMAKLGIEQRREDREDVKTGADIAMRQNDQAMQVEQRAVDTAFREREAGRAERGEYRADRQTEFAERQAMTERTENNG